jgi:hypothetical protein
MNILFVYAKKYSELEKGNNIFEKLISPAMQHSLKDGKNYCLRGHHDHR